MAIEAGALPSMLRSRFDSSQDVLQPLVYQSQANDIGSPSTGLARASEAAYLLDKIHRLLHQPSREYLLDRQELDMTVETIAKLQDATVQEVNGKTPLYDITLVICYL
jgi:hypothetical protein